MAHPRRATCVARSYEARTNFSAYLWHLPRICEYRCHNTTCIVPIVLHRYKNLGALMGARIPTFVHCFTMRYKLTCTFGGADPYIGALLLQCTKTKKPLARFWGRLPLPTCTATVVHNKLRKNFGAHLGARTPTYVHS